MSAGLPETAATAGTSPYSRLGPGTEFDMIRRIWQRLGTRAAHLGDDCALIDLDGTRLAVSVDMAIEDTHFRRGWLAPAELGWRAMTAALSDLAAVAAAPRGVLVSLGLSPEMPDDWASDVMEGVGEAAAEVGAAVWGGDLVRSERIVIDAVVLGTFNGEAVRRSGARAGDVIAVTGRLGGVGTALSALLDGRAPDHAARDRFARPHARVAHAQWLRDRGVRAMIDVSDGLVADTGHLAAASEIGIDLDQSAIPLHPAAHDTAAAASSGEEYELVVAIPAGPAVKVCDEFETVFDLPLTAVGKARSGDGVTVMVDGHPVQSRGTFRHF